MLSPRPDGALHRWVDRWGGPPGGGLHARSGCAGEREGVRGPEVGRNRGADRIARGGGAPLESALPASRDEREAVRDAQGGNEPGREDRDTLRHLEVDHLPSAAEGGADAPTRA